MAFKHCGQKENFNPRAPCGARRSKFPSQGGKTVFQPTRPLRGATTRCRRTARRKCISTHAPLAGRDTSDRVPQHGRSHFNPRAPCGARLHLKGWPRPQIDISTHAPLAGRDYSFSTKLLSVGLFQPPPPLRGATPSTARNSLLGDFNPRAPCGARRLRAGRCNLRQLISTHAPLAGRDVSYGGNIAIPTGDFNPRAPCGARQHQQSGRQLRQLISTHAPLAGRDSSFSGGNDNTNYFNPRAPCGARRATAAKTKHGVGISTHAPLAGRD